MDNVSHTLVGAAMGKAGLKKLTGLAMPTLMIAANIPDLDALAMFTDHALTFRRGWTHGPIGLVVLPIMLALCMVGWDRWQQHRGKRPAGRLPVRPWQVLLLAYVGTLSHPFLDWLNTYGIRLLMPFSHQWFYGDALFIIDPWLWLLMCAGIFLTHRRERKNHPAPFRPARASLAVLVLYIGLMVIGSRAASHMAERELAAQGIAPVERLMAGPMPVNAFHRELVFDTGREYGFGTISLLPRMNVSIDAERLPVNRDLPAVQAAMQRREIRDFLYWSRFPYFFVEEEEGGTRVHANDVRFARSFGGDWARVSVFVADQ